MRPRNDSGGSSAGRVRLAMTIAILAALGILASPTSSFASSAPVIVAPSASVAEDSATLEAQVRPGGLETRYEFWLRYAVCQPSAGGGSCGSVAVERVGEGEVSASRLEQAVSVNLTSLHSDYTYEFWLSASNSDGTRESSPLQFTIPPPSAGAPEGTGAGPPVDSEQETWNQEGAKREAEEAPRLEAEREAKKKKEEEERSAKPQPDPTVEQGHPTMCIVPALKGDSLAAARAALRKAQCRLGKVTGRREGKGRLVVVSQDHHKAEKVPLNTPVAVIISRRQGTGV